MKYLIYFFITICICQNVHSQGYDAEADNAELAANYRMSMLDSISNEYKIDTDEELRSIMEDSVKRRKLYDKASKRFNLGTYEEFETAYYDKPISWDNLRNAGLFLLLILAIIGVFIYFELKKDKKVAKISEKVALTQEERKAMTKRIAEAAWKNPEFKRKVDEKIEEAKRKNEPNI